MLPDQIIEPAPSVTETVQTINATLGGVALPTLSSHFVIERTSTPSTSVLAEEKNDATTISLDTEDDSNLAMTNKQNMAGIVAGIVLVVLTVVVSTIVFSIVIVVLVQLKTRQRKKFDITDANQYMESPAAGKFKGKASYS